LTLDPLQYTIAGRNTRTVL